MLSAIYILWMYQRVMTGPPIPEVVDVPDVDRREVGTVVPLLVALVVFGFFPMPLLDVINPTVETTLEQVGVSDDGPTVSTPVPTGEEDNS